MNTSVELYAEGWATHARSLVEDVTADTLVVSRPERADDGSPVSADDEQSLRLTWTAEDALYDAEVVLTGQADGQLPTWTLSLVGSVKRNQRREAFRLIVQLSSMLGTERTLAGMAQVHDLSETGMRCTPPAGTSFECGDRVWVELPLPGSSVRLDAKVVRTCEASEIGLTFANVHQADADAIRQYLFTEQLARRAQLAT